MIIHVPLLQDMGVSVRKRVIKIMKDICVQQPDFSRVNEICVKMIRRINDEEGIKVRAMAGQGHRVACTRHICVHHNHYVVFWLALGDECVS